MRDQAVDAAQHRGLAAARRADHREDFALADVEVDVAEHFERAVALAEPATRMRGSALHPRGCADAHSAACDCGVGLSFAQ